MAFSNWIAIAGLIGLVIYCVETWKIRTASQAQLEAQRTPCVTFATIPRDGNEALLDAGGARGTMVLDSDAGDVMIENIGNGPAVNVEYVLNAQGGPARKLDGYVPFIPPGARATIPVSRNALQARPFDCHIQYDSLSFTRYETKLTIQNLVLTAPFEFGKAIVIVEESKGKAMWLLKGLLSGLAVFVIFTLFYLRSVIGPSQPGRAIAVSVIAGTTIHQPLFWVTFAAVLVAAVLCARLLQQFT